MDTRSRSDSPNSLKTSSSKTTRIESKELQEVQDLLLAVLWQSAGVKVSGTSIKNRKSKIDHKHKSVYENAIYYLINNGLLEREDLVR